MNRALSPQAMRATEYRDAFDRAFAEPSREDHAAREELLVIRICGDLCGLRLSEISGVFAGKKVVPVPGSAVTLRGIAGFRGAILPVYDLGAIFGHTSGQNPRWLVVAAAAPVAFAFQAFEKQLRVPRSDIIAAAQRQDASGHMRDFVRSEDFSGPIVHLPSILDAIKAPKIETAKTGALNP
jgi:chemotaxis signal transduction protein